MLTYCDVAPVQLRVTSRTVAKKVCPVADRVIVPGGGGGGGGGGAGVSPEKSSRFGEPEPALATTPCVALDVIAAETSAGVAAGFVSR